VFVPVVHASSVPPCRTRQQCSSLSYTPASFLCATPRSRPEPAGGLVRVQTCVDMACVAPRGPAWPRMAPRGPASWPVVVHGLDGTMCRHGKSGLAERVRGCSRVKRVLFVCTRDRRKGIFCLSRGHTRFTIWGLFVYQGITRDERKGVFTFVKESRVIHEQRSFRLSRGQALLTNPRAWSRTGGPLQHGRPAPARAARSSTGGPLQHGRPAPARAARSSTGGPLLLDGAWSPHATA
jgi:hypothetical protein